MNTNKWIYLTYISLALSSCGGGSGTTPQSNETAHSPVLNEALSDKNISQLGLVSIGLDSQLMAFAQFHKLKRPLEISDLAIKNTNQSQTDTVCEAHQVDLEEFYSEFWAIDAKSLSASQIDAGQTILIESPNGTWGEIERREYADGEVMEYSFFQSGLLPDTPSLSITGAEFPAFNSIPISNFAPIKNTRITKSSNYEITADSIITWSYDAHESEMLSIDFHSDLSEDKIQVYNCNVKNTGTFKPNDFLNSSIGNGGLFFTRLYKSKVDFHREENSLLVVTQYTNAIGIDQPDW